MILILRSVLVARNSDFLLVSSSQSVGLYRAFNAFMQALSLKSLKFLQKIVLNIIFPGGEHATNLIISNIEVLSQDNRNSRSFSLDGHHSRAPRKASS